VLPLFQACSSPVQRSQALAPFLGIPLVSNLIERLGQLQTPPVNEQLSPKLAEALYGDALLISVSRLEHFAACPFRFFVGSGLRVEERRRFELDVREQGSFQHDVLALFHRALVNEGKRWRDLTPAEARDRMAEAVSTLSESYRSGLLIADSRSLFATRGMALALQDFIEIVTTWMEQYEFDPEAVELGFGLPDDLLPAWKLQLDDRHQLLFRGKIDRVDLLRRPGGESAFCVVIDYKSSARKLDPVLMGHGIQLQLAAYLNVLRSLPEAAALFRLERIIPAGIFYANLRGRYEKGSTRRSVLGSRMEARKRAYRHTGRFQAAVVRHLDRRAVQKGDQFNYAFGQNGELRKDSSEALDDGHFREMLDAIETHLREMGRAIFAGEAKVNPYRRGIVTACDQCQYRRICRIDPWTHRYRMLGKSASETGSDACGTGHRPAS
jgi:ATP-dependent helicase/nuclease subunit B